MVCCFSLHAQDDVKAAQTKMDEFVSQTGTIIKFEDYDLPNLRGSIKVHETSVRAVSAAGQTAYFFRIKKVTKYKTITAAIAYEDLQELIKATNSLKAAVPGDEDTASDWLENKFVTDDGFFIGYYVSAGKTKWYIQLDKYSSDNIIFIRDIDQALSLFGMAVSKIEELK